MGLKTIYIVQMFSFLQPRQLSPLEQEKSAFHYAHYQWRDPAPTYSYEQSHSSGKIQPSLVNYYRAPGVMDNFNKSRHEINVSPSSPFCQLPPMCQRHTRLSLGGFSAQHYSGTALQVGTPSLPRFLSQTIQACFPTVPCRPAWPHCMCGRSDPCAQLLFPLNSTLTVPSLGSWEVYFSSLSFPDVFY